MDWGSVFLTLLASSFSPLVGLYALHPFGSFSVGLCLVMSKLTMSLVCCPSASIKLILTKIEARRTGFSLQVKVHVGKLNRKG